MSLDRSTPVALETVRDSELWDDFARTEDVVAAAVSAAFAEAELEARADAELAVILSDDARVAALNAEWRGRAGATNVLTFPAVGPAETADAAMLGDVILAHETVAREAREQGKTLQDHLAHLVVHGVLHLFGHDHLGAREADAMEAIETRALARLGVPDPYADQDPCAARDPATSG